MAKMIEFPGAGSDEPENQGGAHLAPETKKISGGKLAVRFITAFLTLALVAGAAALVVFHDRINMDSIKRMLTYQSMDKDENGQSEEIFFDNDASNCFSALDNNLIVCSNTSLELYGQSGTAYINETVNFTHPAIDADGSYAVVYDVGGKALYGLVGRTLAYSDTDSATILSARVNSNGYLAVVTQQTGYKGVVTVYDSSYTAKVQENISSAYVVDAIVSENGKLLVVATISEADTALSTTITFYEVSTGEIVTAQTLSGQYELSMSWGDGLLWIQSDQGMTAMSTDGVIVGSQVDSDRYLRNFAFGGTYQLMTYGQYKKGNQGELTLVDSTGTQLGALSITEEVLSVDANEKYFALLFANELHIYTSDMELYATLEDTAGARRVLVRTDGSALLVSAQSAALYVP